MADKVQEHDKKVLHSMGYAQELSRRMGGFSDFAISFSSFVSWPAAFPLSRRLLIPQAAVAPYSSGCWAGLSR
jgi:hypothetical protein